MRISGIRPTHIDFGFSAARESLRAVDVFLHPAKHAEQMPWVRSVRRRVLPDLRKELQHHRFLFNEHPEIFPRVWRAREARSFDAELVTLERSLDEYRDAVVRRLQGTALLDRSELQRLRRPSWYKRSAAVYMREHPSSRAFLAAFTKSPSGSLRRFCAMLRCFYAAAIESEWGDIVMHLQSDIQSRRRVLRTYGAVALLRTLDENMTVLRTQHGAAIDVGAARGNDLVLGPSDALTLTPSFFVWPHRQVHVLKGPHGLQCTVAYALPPLTRRRPTQKAAQMMVSRFSAVGHPQRWRILELLAARGLSTRELAGYLRVAEPLVSRHLQRLLAAGLVSRRRAGYFVLYSLHREAFAEIATVASEFAPEPMRVR